jgi:hypothetical protein
MIRTLVVLTLWLSISAQSLLGQVEISARGGVHIDRAPEHDRLVTTGGAAMYAARGEASALGVRIGYWHRPTFGFQFDVSRSSNASWSGSTPLPPPAFANRTTYLSARAVARTSSTRGFQMALAAGPAVMIYGGPGTNLRTRGADVGGVLEVSGRLRLAHRLAFELAVSNYLYGSTYLPDGSDSQTTQSVLRHDLLLLPTLVFTWP